jgi:hypothetical protein
LIKVIVQRGDCVKITIDTSQDSHEDIRRVISLLSTMLDKQPSGSGQTSIVRDIFASTESTLPVLNTPANVFSSKTSGTSKDLSQNNMFAMFDGFSPQSPSSESEDENDKTDEMGETEETTIDGLQLY